MWRIYWNLCLCQGIFVLGIWMVLHMWRTSAACFRELFSTSLSAKTYLSSRNLTSACDVWRMAVNTAQDGELTRTSAASYLYWSLESRSSQINVLTCATQGNNKMQHQLQTLKYIKMFVSGHVFQYFHVKCCISTVANWQQSRLLISICTLLVHCCTPSLCW